MAEACQEEGCSVEAVSNLLDQLKAKKMELEVCVCVRVLLCIFPFFLPMDLRCMISSGGRDDSSSY